MKRRFELRATAALFALLVVAGPALAQQQQQSAGGSTVYTWVDKQGVRHYSDRPDAPNAVPVTLSGPSTMPVLAAPPASAAPPGTAKTAATAPASAASKAQLAARCTQLRNQVQLLQSARRIQVKHKDGSTEWFTGENAVKYRNYLQMKMQQACAAAAATPGT